VGRDFDFFGNTAQVSNAIEEEQMRYNLGKPRATQQYSQPQVQAPKRTGYERYHDPGFIPEIQAKSNVWGTKPAQASSQDASLISTARPGAAASRKVMSLEEVEAAMRAQTQPVYQQQRSMYPPPVYQHPSPHPQMPPQQFQQMEPPPTVQAQLPPPEPPVPKQRHIRTPSAQDQGRATQPLQILQNPNRAKHSPQPSQDRAPAASGPSIPSQPTHPLPVITNPQQLMELSEDQRKAYLEEDAKRAKRNHKIFLLSKGNGLMTPQDKNFITRIQLQQLVSATGNSADPSPEAALAEDFYYQVYSQIRGAPRQHPTQPLGHFAQTYLFQTGGRMGGNRRNPVNGANHMQRMQQQVQRAVEAAKLKPKNKQLIIEGSLGKISFSNAKTPKPLLNIKRQDSSDPRPVSRLKQSDVASASDRKTILRNIEAVYTVLMQMEDHERQMPPPPVEGDADAIQAHLEWRRNMQKLNSQLWQDLKVLDPIVPGSLVMHPFIAFLSFAKGKKAIPRVFRHIDQEQRITILTMIVIHLDQLDVVSDARIAPGETQPPPAVREEIELFLHTVVESLHGYINEAPMNIIIGILGLLIDHTNVVNISKTRIGLTILTMLLSRAEIAKHSGHVSDDDLQQWTSLFDRLFDILEPVLDGIFPAPVNTGDDMYIWQFLAAVGAGASPEQQQRLVIGVK
jgi:DNA topoisomerase 2-associated protein PAT1